MIKYLKTAPIIYKTALNGPKLLIKSDIRQKIWVSTYFHRENIKNPNIFMFSLWAISKVSQQTEVKGSLSPVSTWMGDRLGTLIFFSFGVYGPIGLKLGSIAHCGMAGRKERSDWVPDSKCGHQRAFFSQFWSDWAEIRVNCSLWHGRKKGMLQ